MPDELAHSDSLVGERGIDRRLDHRGRGRDGEEADLIERAQLDCARRGRVKRLKQRRMKQRGL